MIFRDTIAAIATPPGIGGIGLIRVSGLAAEGIARRLFRPSPSGDFLSHRLYHGEIVSPGTGAILDTVLTAFLKGPRSYTGEDTLEISCHGGPLVLRTVLEEVLRAGARPAERGEFTKRAYLNDRLDLAQAEAVLDIINAQTRPGLAAAVGRLKGNLSGRIEAIRRDLIDLLAGIEAAIDFSEDDGVEETPGAALSRIREIIAGIAALAATYHQGRIYREGIGVVIAGRPNVGKSSLLNRLLGEQRAIVTSIPGTTRDFIEETVDIGGIPVRLTDTAGLHSAENAIEKEGIDLAWERLEKADAVLLLLDGSTNLTKDDRDILVKMIAKPRLLVLNKSDLPARLDEESLKGFLSEGTTHAVRISAKYGNGIDCLTAALRDLVLATEIEEAPGAMIAHLHHKIALEKATEGLVRACDGLLDGLHAELVALELREALDTLGEITGRTTPKEVLDRIFTNFCIGK
jgi:tRNA modification GTPase